MCTQLNINIYILIIYLENHIPKIPTDVNFTVVAAKTVYGERRFFAIFQVPLFSSSFFTILVTFHVAVWHCGWAWVGQMHRQLNTYISRNLSLTIPLYLHSAHKTSVWSRKQIKISWPSDAFILDFMLIKRIFIMRQIHRDRWRGCAFLAIPQV